jgi:hypothetical protein
MYDRDAVPASIGVVNRVGPMSKQAWVLGYPRGPDFYFNKKPEPYFTT